MVTVWFSNNLVKRVSFGSKDCTKELKLEYAYFLARLASFCHLEVISDPLIVLKFNNETHDPKGQENKIYTIVKGREMFFCHHTVPVTSCSEVKYVLKRVSFGSKDCPKELKRSTLFGTIFPSIDYCAMYEKKLKKKGFILGAKTNVKVRDDKDRSTFSSHLFPCTVPEEPREQGVWTPPPWKITSGYWFP